MSVTDINLQSELPSIQTHHKMNSVPEFPLSLERDPTEQPADLASDDEDPHVVQRYSRTSSLCDDSGFNSSASEDRDDTTDRSLRQKLDFDCVKSLSRNHDSQGHNNTPDLLLKGKTRSSESNNTDISHNVKNSPMEMKLSNSAISHENSEPVISNRCLRSNISDNSLFRSNISDNVSVSSNISDNSSANSDISIRNSGRISRRHRTDNQNSQAIAGAPVTPRVSRSRRHRPRDLNNNDSAHKDLNSYLSSPPFKLQDCFQNQGLLSLVACITYTVVLMIIFCLLGVICNYIKSVVGKQNLRDLRADIVQSRHTRSNMASG